MLAPATFAAVEERFAVALLGPGGAVAAGARLALLAVHLHAAAAGYAVTETRALLLVGEIEAGLRGRPGELTAALADLVAGSVPGGGPIVARLLSATGRVSPILADDGAVDVTSSGPVPVPPAAGVGDLLGLVAAAYPAGAVPPGSVAVQRVLRPDGSRAWVVAIPGTQEWGPVPASDPLDLTSGVTALAAGPSAASALVVRALELAGAGAGSPCCRPATASGDAGGAAGGRPGGLRPVLGPVRGDRRLAGGAVPGARLGRRPVPRAHGRRRAGPRR